MYVTNLFLDRFGDHSELRLDALSEGLAVVFGAPRSGKSTIVHFLQAMFGGFDAELREKYLPTTSRGFGGMLTIQTANGRQTITRYDDGGREGRLTIERPDGAVIGCRSLRNLFGELPLAMLDTVFLVDFDDRPSLDELLQRAAASGWTLSGPPRETGNASELERELSAQRASLMALPPQTESIDSLTRRRRELEAQIDLWETQASRQPDHHAAEDKLAQDVLEATQHLQSLRKEIAALEASLQELNARRSRLSVPTSATRYVPTDESSRQLATLDEQIDRWKRTLRDVVARRSRVAEQADNSQRIGAKSADPNEGTTRPLRSMKHRILTMKNIVDQLASHMRRDCQCEQWKEVCSDLLRGLQRDFDHLGTALRRKRLEQRHRRILAECDQLQRLEVELRQSIQLLNDRRNALSRGEVAIPSRSPDWRRESVRPRSQGERDELSAEISRLAEVRLKWLAESDEWLVELVERQAELDNLRKSVTSLGTKSSAELAEKRAELAALDVAVTREQRRRDLVQSVVALERQLESLRSLPAEENIVANAADYLRRLSAGQWRKVEITGQREAWVEDDRGRRCEQNELDDGGRDQVYLSFCLALAAACARRGQQMPLMLNAAFNHFPAQTMRHVLDVLGDFARHHQLVFFTRFEHVVELARLCKIPVHYLSAATLRVTDETQVVANELDPTLEPAATAEPLRRRRKKRNGIHVATKDSLPSSDADDAKFFLREDDPIELAPSLDPALAERLRKIGLLRVGDLLRVEPVEVAADLQQYGVTAEVVAAWSAQSRLVCGVRGLRPYDARLLVACGIHDPQQLFEMQPATLRSRIKEFSATAEGRSILTSGTEQELSRVTDWIRLSRKTPDRGLVHNEAPTAAPEPVHLLPAPTTLRKARRSTRTVHANSSAEHRVHTAAPADRAHDAEPAKIMPLSSSGSRARSGLQLTDEVRRAPSIGPVMAQRLDRVGIVTVGDLLSSSPDVVAAKVGIVRITAETIQRWQQQADLLCHVPALQDQGSQLLVGAGVTSVQELAAFSPAELHARVSVFAESIAGKRLLRSRTTPTLAQIGEWIAAARTTRSANAA